MNTMQEVLQLATHPLNVVYTFLLVLVILYWFSVILGAVDMSVLDFDVDVDMDVDVDVDADVDADADASVGGWFAAVFHFFHLDRLPFMLIMSIVVLSAWTMAILSNHYWGNYSLAFALAMTAPIILVAFLAAKILSYPLLPLFARANQAVLPVEYIGLECTVTLSPYGNNFGQAVALHNEDELLVRIKSRQEIANGQRAVIIGRTEKDDIWLVEPL